MHRFAATRASRVLAGAAWPALADHAPLLPREKLAPAEFPVTAAWIAAELAAGGRFQHVTARERDAVEGDRADRLNRRIQQCDDNGRCVSG